MGWQGLIVFSKKLSATGGGGLGVAETTDEHDAIDTVEALSESDEEPNEELHRESFEFGVGEMDKHEVGGEGFMDDCVDVSGELGEDVGLDLFLEGPFLKYDIIPLPVIAIFYYFL